MALWPNELRIEVLGATGEVGSGKTCFVMTIDPAHTLLFDFEKSASAYSQLEGMGLKRIDYPKRMAALKPDYQPVDMFSQWLQDVATIERGKFSVIALDTIGDIETGLADYVASKHADYGFSSAEKFQSTGGIFWKFCRERWKTILIDLADRCETFAFTSHLRQVWAGGRPTNRREPVGKSTLAELASLYLWLDREQDNPPSARVTAPWGKSRLAVFSKDGTIQPILPPRLPIATPAAIRAYIQSPPTRLKKGEKAHVEELTEAQRLQLQAQIAADTAETLRLKSEMRTGATTTRREIPERKGASPAKRSPRQPQESGEAARADEHLSKGLDISTAADSRATAEQLDEMRLLASRLELSKEKWKRVLDRFKVDSAKSLTADEADQLLASMRDKLQATEIKSGLDQWAQDALKKTGRPA